MKLTPYSVNRFNSSFAEWNVEREFATPIFNYFVHGFEPGGFFTALLANDFVGAMTRSHPANTVESIKALCKWLINQNLKGVAWGDYKTVDKWLDLDVAVRRAVLEQSGLIYPEDQEIWMTLKGEKTQAPVFF